MKFNKMHIGSSVEDWLKDEGILEESTNAAEAVGKKLKMELV